MINNTDCFSMEPGFMLWFWSEVTVSYNIVHGNKAGQQNKQLKYLWNMDVYVRVLFWCNVGVMWIRWRSVKGKPGACIRIFISKITKDTARLSFRTHESLSTVNLPWRYMHYGGIYDLIQVYLEQKIHVIFQFLLYF